MTPSPRPRRTCLSISYKSFLLCKMYFLQDHIQSSSKCRRDISCILGVLAVLFLWNNRVRSCVSLKWRGLVWMPEAAFNAKIKWVCWYSVFQTGAITASTLVQQRSCSTELFPCVFYFQDKTPKICTTFGIWNLFSVTVCYRY